MPENTKAVAPPATTQQITTNTQRERINVSERNWATREQAADHLGVHPNTIDKWRNDGLIAAYRIGPRLVRYDINEIDAALVAASTEETPTDA